MKIQSWKTPHCSVNYWPTIYTRLQSSAHELSIDCKTSWNKIKWWCFSWGFLANSKARTYAQEPLWQLVRGGSVSLPPGADDHNLEPFCSFMKNVSNILPDTFSFSFECGHFARLKATNKTDWAAFHPGGNSENKESAKFRPDISSSIAYSFVIDFV